MRQFDPDTVITFGTDGGYGHPDHVAISGLTTETFHPLAHDHGRRQRLYHAVFPPRRTSMAEELAHWITDSGQRAADRAALQAITLFAGESATMRLARDDVRVEWFPPGACVVEKGEPANALYLILNGTADRLLEQADGQVTRQRRMRTGDFFGEIGLVAGKRPAHVVARDSLTCLVLSRTPVTPYAGRGTGADSPAEPAAAVVPSGTWAVDVTSHLHRKLGALARHRTQYPIVPSMLPHSLLQKMLGTEFFHHVTGGSAKATDRPASGPRAEPATHPPTTLRAA
jgi:LmbE family N-acetylglucosaminyl deacetylase